MQNIFRKIIYFLLALAAISVLGFLYIKGLDFSIARQQNAAEKLRDLRQLDADMDAGVLRTNVGLVGDYDPLAEAMIAMQTSTDALSLDYQWEGADPTLLRNVKQQVEEKTALADRFKAENAVLKNSLRYLPTVYDEVHASNETSVEIKNHIERIFQTVLRYSLFSDLGVQQAGAGTQNTREAIEADLNALESLIEAHPAVANETAISPLVAEEQTESDALITDNATAFVMHSRAVLRQSKLVTQRMEEIFAVPLVKSLNSMSVLTQQSSRTTLAAGEKQRIYLLSYAAFLLLVVFYFAVRLTLSFRQVSVANKKLKEVNETLELRVQERTVDLENALQELKLSESQLVQSEKMASLGQMVAGVAHEINTPLAYVRSTLETIETNIVSSPLRDFVQAAEQLLGLMGQEGSSDEALSTQFALANQALDSLGGEGLVLIDEMGILIKDGIYGADQIKELVLNLRNFSRLDKERVAFFQIEEGIDSALMLAKNVLKTRKVVKKYGAIPPVSCSPSQINQVVLNIINNAAQATPEGGSLVIETFQDAPEFVNIRISDNGSGIDQEHLRKIFDPFFTTKEIGQGTGLGLSIVYKIIKEHGGNINVDSELGKGSSFLISLPVKQNVPQA